MTTTTGRTGDRGLLVLRRIRCMLSKEFRQMLRDPRMRAIIFVMPVVQLVVIAFALTTDVTDVRTAVLDMDGTPSSRELIADFTSSGWFRIVAMLPSEAAVTPVLDAGDVRAAIHIPRGFEADIRGGRTARVQVIADATDSNNASIVFGYSSHIVAAFSGRRQRERLAARGGVVPDPVSFETRAWFNPNLESRHYYVPGLVAVMLLTVSLLLTSIAIVREKEIGTIEQVLVTPIRGAEFILGKTVPYLAVGYILLTIMLAIVAVVFGIHVRGSVALLYILAGVYFAGNVGLALVISVISSTQQQALLTAFCVLLPAVLLSGFMFPVRNMPEPVQVLTWLNPMRWFLEILRGVTEKGSGLAELRTAVVGQTALAVAFLSIAALRFRKTAA